MIAIAYLIPIALLLGGAGLAAFFWAVRSGQYDDLDGAAQRVLIGEDRPRPPIQTPSPGVRGLAVPGLPDGSADTANVGAFKGNRPDGASDTEQTRMHAMAAPKAFLMLWPAAADSPGVKVDAAKTARDPVFWLMVDPRTRPDIEQSMTATQITLLGRLPS